MDIKLFSTIFITVFIAELGDKTQLATFLFAADKQASRWLVFAAAATALILATAIGVLAGSVVADKVDEKLLSYVAGAGFILIGAYTIYRA